MLKSPFAPEEQGIVGRPPVLSYGLASLTTQSISENFMTRATVHRWSDLPTDAPMPLLERQRVVGARMMISRLVLLHGFSVPIHAHENEQISCVLSGKLRFHIQDGIGGATRTIEVGAGEVLVLPPWVPHGAEAIEDCVALDLFSPPSQATGIDMQTAITA
jgi:quercetin dioxygenase-like cupin family protein